LYKVCGQLKLYTAYRGLKKHKIYRFEKKSILYIGLIVYMVQTVFKIHRGFKQYIILYTEGCNTGIGVEHCMAQILLNCGQRKNKHKQRTALSRSDKTSYRSIARV
jgi:hypothetical protein